jgi:hypothetical protein
MAMVVSLFSCSSKKSKKKMCYKLMGWEKKREKNGT